ncbi:MAG: hypothetical protein QMD86_01050 [Patescibacteria group bacterium]|nr:hypothetical protein [Patescibacteria group bacterium]
MAADFQKIKKDFIRLISGNSLFHAYLFFGSSPDDILLFSEELINFLEKDIFEKPSGFLNDFFKIEPRETLSIGIDEIRELRNFLYQKPVISKKRTAIIYKADSLTAEAQSAILKIIEEPPKDSLIILICQSDENLMETIKSRIHKIFFPSLEKNIKNKLEENAEKLLITELLKLKSDPIKNFAMIKEILNRLTLIKQFNLNKKLQLRTVGITLKTKPVKPYSDKKS